MDSTKVSVDSLQREDERPTKREWVLKSRNTGYLEPLKMAVNDTNVPRVLLSKFPRGFASVQRYLMTTHDKVV